MITVNPCPFCGHDDVEFSEVEPGTYAVDCPECQCIGPFADTTDEARLKWNKPGVHAHELTILRHENDRLRIAEHDLGRVRFLRANDANEIIRLGSLVKDLEDDRQQLCNRSSVLTEMCHKHEREIERLRIAEQDHERVRRLRAYDAKEIIRLEGLIKMSDVTYAT
jgi:hypothetical protein